MASDQPTPDPAKQDFAREELRLEQERLAIERMHAEKPRGAVIIQADKESRNELLVQVMDAARLAGVKNISIAAEVSD